MENLDRPAKLKEFAETCANGRRLCLKPAFNRRFKPQILPHAF